MVHAYVRKYLDWTPNILPNLNKLQDRGLSGSIHCSISPFTLLQLVLPMDCQCFFKGNDSQH